MTKEGTAISTTDSDANQTNNNSYASVPNKLVSAANGIDYAYRDTGPTADDNRWSFCSISGETSTTGIPR